MAQLILTDARIYMGGYDLSGDHNELALEYEAEMKDVTTFGSGGTRIMKPGLLTGSFNGKGFYEAAVDDAVLFNKIGVTSDLMTIFSDAPVEGSAIGAYGFQIAVGKYAPISGGAIGELLKFDLNAMLANGTPVIRAYPLKSSPSTFITATANGSIFNVGAISATQKLYAGLHVFAQQGTSPTLDVTIQSAALVGFGSPTTRMTFTQVTGAGTPQAQWKTPVSGAITDAFWRATYTIGGSATPGFKFLVWMGIR